MGWTPLLWAAAHGNVDMVRTLVENGAQLLKPRKDGVTILHIAACENDVRMLDYVCKAKTTKSIDLPMNDGCTPAHQASSRGSFDALNFLIEHGSDLCKRNDLLHTCFDEIIMQDNLDLLECVYQYSRNLKRNYKDAGHFQMIHNAAGTQSGSKCL
jgi:ankyrin repeat protein